ncbi:MAG: hypothetical protein A2750_00080 [Candidatus Yanofskybacteria bacterium RIFCSPHIGHO2_01_FULL_45_42]|uniref:Uncharacterized protein n=3 Tax=Candidatus Yanofskyibacteriota TaxID=1752733 RepID=A0A1F8F5A2_9BACT|nr:MAG: hypothetical protein A2750_00080 [Candidatus Yanofskybacteria bacterium RIFCSPHIGHO2_01_FULL_45_42]OGN15875.1 MAG: hypothetical protein A3C81_02165 [Candidatus Yanofskybacteria bacterium RIFCSPHIGHO2_02_FULL_46_19]OGN27452.1 MAG: hypothetical protein A3B17_01620 [Candidatus Yanofskybacteria bacterium RIFCSPLOWO2_01_FULL_45_72]OGN32313.1 MAG: hypothetical protein A3J01_02530 [Candidatus Yanofskybacteria bacterium RIFCSPLOWO2_02_FULL_45_18]
MNQKGFANIILVVVLVVILAGVAGYFFLVKKSPEVAQQPTPTPTQTKTPVSPIPTPTPVTSTTQNYKGTGFSVSYPKSWVIQNHSCSDMGGTDCINLAPAAAIAYYKQKYGNDSLSLAGFSAHKTNQTPREWLGTIIGGGTFAEDKQITINGYSATFVKSVAPNAYTDYYYAVADKGTMVYFVFRSYSESPPYGQSVQIDDYSQYLSDFRSIVNSIKFN